MFKTILRSIRRFIPALLTLTIAATGLSSCAPKPPEDDEGHATFAREIIPALLGRRAHGVDEVEAVADISQLLGRNVAISMLMKDPQYVDYWSDQIIDILSLQRGVHTTAAQDQTCWAEPSSAFSPVTTDLAEWVRDHGPTDAGAPSGWNMADLVRSAVLLDDLSPVYRAYLFPVSMRLGAAADRKAIVADQFLSYYLNRNATCLRCHNPEYSTSNVEDSGGNIVWRRLWTIPGHAEVAVFGDYSDDVATRARLDPIFRGDVRKAVSSGPGIRPWGMAASCAKDTNSTSATNSGTPVFQDFKLLGSGDPQTTTGAMFGSLDQASTARVSIWELEAALSNGISSLSDGYERLPPSSGGLTPDQQRFCDLPIMTPTCTSCHSGSSPAGQLNLAANDVVAQLSDVNAQSAGKKKAKRVVSGNPGASELFSRVSDSTPSGYQMPRFAPALSAAEQQNIEDWITSGPFDMVKSDCNVSSSSSSSSLPNVDPDEAFAFLTATNAVDGIWMAAMGNRLTIDHGFPRNAAQRNMLWHLTEYQLVAKGWSLKAVLSHIFASAWYARRAPEISQRENAYQLPPILDPWIVASPVTTPDPSAHEEFNGQGELADRHRVNSIIRSLSATLGWKVPERFPGSGYPSNLSGDLGQYVSSASPGFDGVNFQSLLALEVNAGLCSKAGHTEGSDDWLDALAGAIALFNTSNPDAPLTIGEAWAVVKDRLIQDPTIERTLHKDQSASDGDLTEEEALIAFMSESSGISGGVDLNTSTGVYSAATLETKLRQACGVIVKTPEFLLRNITPRGYSDVNMPDPPRLNVCLPGETACGGYAQSCGHWRGRLQTMGRYINCGDRTVYKAPLFELLPIPGDLFRRKLWLRTELLCLSDRCRFVPVSTKVDICLRDPRRCETISPPILPCDPRIDGCGMLSQPDLRDRGVLLARYEGAVVTDARGVSVRRAGSGVWSDLDVQQRLQAGDLLMVPFDATLSLRLDDRTISVDPIEQRLEEAELEGLQSQLISVTGPSAESVLSQNTKPGTISVAELRKNYQEGIYESRAVSEADAARILRYEHPLTSVVDPTPEEIEAINEDFANLHPEGWTGDPLDGITLEDEIPPPPVGPVDEKFGFEFAWLLVLIALILLASWLLFFRKKSN